MMPCIKRRHDEILNENTKWAANAQNLSQKISILPRMERAVNKCESLYVFVVITLRIVS
jgi:hypothetical protein